VKAFILGAGAQGRVVLEILRAQAHYQSIAFLDDDAQLWGKQINGATVLGGFEYATQQQKESCGVVVALGKPEARLAVAEKIKAHSLGFVNAVHPSAVIAPSASLGEGNMICAGAVVHSNATIGNNVIINIGAMVDHDSVVEDGATLCPRVFLGGRVSVGRGAFIGSGAIVLPRISIGAGSVIGAGAMVAKDVPPGVKLVPMLERILLQPVGEDFDWKGWL